MAERVAEEQMGDWHDAIDSSAESIMELLKEHRWLDAGRAAGRLEGIARSLLAELEAERARRDAYPQLSVEWRRDAPCGYPHVDIRHNGMRAVGWVVPDGLEDRLPSFFDGLTWSNPLLPPVLALRVLTVRYDLLERLLTKAAAVLQGELDGFYKGDELYVE